MKEYIQSALKQGIDLRRICLEDSGLISNIAAAVKNIVQALKQGGKICLFGNGGSAADAQHIAAELVGRLRLERNGLRAIALTTNTSTVTALANDYGYEHIFTRQLEAVGVSGDVAFGISTSGSSANVLNGLLLAKKLGMTTVGLTGKAPNKISEACDIALAIPSSDTQRIQELHIAVGHIICELTEQSLFSQVR
ncbi:MAG: D-sedoheptulose 7-phosphate isomerase [Candidatus Omnitrophica bacterium]|nr:D-sedoheptulose 7-phosphate isomerase [Candidatus Omnitrophota bacterium]